MEYPNMISVRVDVTKIDKKYLYELKNGGKSLDILLLRTENDKYDNDYRAVQGIPKEEREKGERGEILGNARVIGVNPAPRRQTASGRRMENANRAVAGGGVAGDEEDGLPF